MTHRGPFQPLPFCGSVILQVEGKGSGEGRSRWEPSQAALPSPSQLCHAQHLVCVAAHKLQTIVEKVCLCAHVSACVRLPVVFPF